MAKRTKKSPKQLLAMKYGQLIFQARGACANIDAMQKAMNFSTFDVPALLASLETNISLWYEDEKGKL